MGVSCQKKQRQGFTNVPSLRPCGYIILQGISLHHPAMPEDVQKQSLPQQLCKIRGWVFNCVELHPRGAGFP